MTISRTLPDLYALAPLVSPGGLSYGVVSPCHWNTIKIPGVLLGLPREGPHGGSLEQANGSEGPQREMQPYSKHSGSGVSRCYFAIYLYPFSPLRAGDGGHFSTEAEAYVKKRALVAGSL